MSWQPSLTESTLSEAFIRTEYAVRGELYAAAVKRKEAGGNVILTNVGNPQALAQQPLTFVRQVVALVTAPFLLEQPGIERMFPADAIARAREYVANLPGGSIGAYSDSKGNGFVRQQVADFIFRRDGVVANPDLIFLTNGASEGVRLCLKAMIRNERDGVLVPIPQYPLYSASIGLYGGTLLGYHLDESSEWGLDLNEVRSQIQQARARGITVRGFVFINPGNPTGNCLSMEELTELCALAHQERFVLMADEVYQENVYGNRPFISCKKALASMGHPWSAQVELVSFHTVSKGAYGECGFRGGYFELTNIDEGVAAQLYKVSSINLSPNVPGQIALGCMVTPPTPGMPSYRQYNEEHQSVINSLKRRARAITDAFNSMEGVTCQECNGALYSFPQITLPRGAIEAARRAGKAPDTFYCLKLLEATGLSVVPGSGFGQKDGTFHFRTTILPPEKDFKEIIRLFTSFHKDFMREYGSSSGGARGSYGSSRGGPRSVSNSMLRSRL